MTADERLEQLEERGQPIDGDQPDDDAEKPRLEPLAVLRRGRYLFASRGDVPHPRRVVDAALLLLATIGPVVASLLSANDASGETTVVEAVGDLLGWLEPVWTLVYGASWLFAVGIVAVSVLGRQFRLARDLMIAVVLVVLDGGVLGLVVADEWPNLLRSFLSDDGDTYPAVGIAFVVAVVVVARPDLIRPARRMATWLVLLAAVAAIAVDETLPSSVLGGLALGLAAGALVRLVMGSAAGFPDRERVLTGLDDLDIAFVDIRLAPRQPPGVATYLGRTVTGRSVEVRVYGSDARDAQFLAKVWRALSYRDAGPELAFSRLQPVEHESLMTLLAARSGVAVPDVIAAGAAGSGDALLVTAQPEAARLDSCPTGPRSTTCSMRCGTRSERCGTKASPTADSTPTTWRSRTVARFCSTSPAARWPRRRRCSTPT
ncbi:MAG: hypothetical protein ACRD0A_15740 [Acidimicrobiales bacterium]